MDSILGEKYDVRLIKGHAEKLIGLQLDSISKLHDVGKSCETELSDKSEWILKLLKVTY